ncbi:diaminopimelate epimerase [Alteribacter lacisalsi]|uniref:Diaminopimelate epimerase n=1 Tax=Alteribacter lacisalsi TaxID=2045244 RepID=A0A2W0H849_9BACI|nr:diaminopimelate epimerase [Alteribacter lacisalsi]PYZ96270.1 diaminopimelate epimerase [Alteribacter lacisalsi]
MKIPFTKMHGLGNNYIYINEFETALPEEQLPALAVELADQYRGIGSDGMILIGPSDSADVRMRIFNNDGSEAKNCGNGLRCVAKYAFERGLAGEKTTMTIETKSGNVSAEVHVKENQVRGVTVNMGKPVLKRSLIPMTGSEQDQVVDEKFEISGETLRVTAVSMGNPHAVFFVNRIEEAPLTVLGPAIEKDRRFPDWVNAEFVEVVSKTELNFRVWERGSGITQACGTGACAAAVAAVLNGRSDRNEDITVHLAGGDLTIRWDEEGEVWMTGPAEVICDGVYIPRENR